MMVLNILKKGVLLILVTFLFSACNEDKPQENFYAGRVQGSTFHITYFGGNKNQIETGIDSLFSAVDESMSTYLESSDISKINHGDTTVVVDEMFVEVFKTSQLIHKQSQGYFDPTVGVLVNYYGFGPEKYTLKIDSSHVDSLMQYVGLDKVHLTENYQINKSTPGIYIDFNAIAQGYTADRVAVFLNQNGMNNYLVEVGGEIVAKGKNLATKETWRIGIDDPKQIQGKRALVNVIKLQNQGMATSGNYRKFRVDSITGQKYVHTINPLTGFPARNSLLSATVLAENCMLADGYATSFMAMGVEKSKQLLKKLPEVDAYLIFVDGDSTRSFMTPGFKKNLAK